MEVFIIIGLILLNGILSMSEIAMVSARKPRLEADAKRGSRAAKTALKLSGNPDVFLSTIQIGITLIGILTGTRATCWPRASGKCSREFQRSRRIRWRSLR